MNKPVNRILNELGRYYRSRVLVVYGESGLGKTSLLRSGLQNAVPVEDAKFFSCESALIRSSLSAVR